MSEINYKNTNRKIKNYSFLSLSLIAVIGIIIRLVFLPYDLPLYLDSFSFFTYSLALIEQGPFPSEYININFGWPSFVSIFFLFTDDMSMIKLMMIQKIISLIISVVTIIPVYYLLKKFFQKNVAIIGSAIFCFEPHLIMNSIAGGTMPLFVCLTTTVIYFSLVNKTKFYFLSFIFVALTSFIRYEGLLLFIPVFISIFLQKNTIRKKIKISCISVLIFLLVLIPIMFVGYNPDVLLCKGCTDYTPVFMNKLPIFAHVFGATITELDNWEDADNIRTNEVPPEIEKESRLGFYFTNALVGFSQMTILLMLPILIICVVPSVFFISKKFTRNRIILIIFSLIISFTGYFAYARGMDDMKYLFPLIPIILLFSCLTIEKLYMRINGKKIGIGLVSGIFIISMVFVVFQTTDYQSEKEIYLSALFIVENANGVNLEPGGKFIKIAELENNWKRLPEIDERNKIVIETKKLSLKNYQNIEKFIQESKIDGLTHIVAYNQNEKEFLTEIFHNEEDFSYLLKVYDSDVLDHKKHIKIFEIDYEVFEKVI